MVFGFFFMLPIILFTLYVKWKLITAAISLIGGWNYLTTQYPSEGIDPGQQLASFNYASAHFGVFADFTKCLKIHMMEHGLLIAPFYSENYIFVAWAQIADIDKKRLMFNHRYKMQIGMKDMKLYGDVGEEVYLYYGHLLLNS